MAQTDHPDPSDLTRGPVSVHVRRIAVPAFVGFFFSTMYNVVDTYFAGRLSTTALAALSLAFPVFFIIVSAGAGMSTGATALMGQALGKGDREQARRYAAQAVSFGLALSLLLTVVGLVLSPFLFRSLGAEGEYLAVCLEYMNVMFLGSVAFLLIHMFNAILNAQGKTKPFRNFFVVGFVLNCGLDPWFIYGGLGVPPMGVAGVALATVLIQAGGAVYMGWQAARSGLLRLNSWRDLLPEFESYRDMTVQGAPSTFNYMTIGLGIYIITDFLAVYGKHAVAAYGVATRVEQIALLPSLGLNYATLALSAQNGGAGKHARVRRTVRTALKYGAWIMVPAGVLVFLLAPQLMSLFTDDRAVIHAGAWYLHIAAFVLFAYVILFVFVAALQGLKRPMFGVWIGLARQIVLPLIVFTLLTEVWNMGLGGVWWGVCGIVWGSALFTLAVAPGYISRVMRGPGLKSSS